MEQTYGESSVYTDSSKTSTQTVKMYHQKQNLNQNQNNVEAKSVQNIDQKSLSFAESNKYALTQNNEKIDYYPSDWITSYKLSESHQNSKIVVFHGVPKPDEVDEVFVKENWI